MTDPSSGPAVPDVIVKKKRGVSIIWIIPIVAAAVAGWIWWSALQEQGPTITIDFQTAEGLEAGKTKLKFKDVIVGQVDDVDLLEDLGGVRATVSTARGVKPYLLDSTRFWVVRPRIGAGGVQGLGTLISGAYIAIDPGTEGAETHEFKGLELPPIAPTDAPGLKVTLVANALGGVGVGDGVYYRQTLVGQVERHRFTDDFERIEIDIYVQPEFKELVTTKTRFWNAGGVDVSLTAEGMRVSMQTVASLLAGGIAFENVEEGGTPAAAGTRFPLYAGEQQARDVYEADFEAYMYFHESVRGLTVGAPVEMRGIRVGSVTAVDLEYLVDDDTFRIPVHIEFERGRATVIGDFDRTQVSQQSYLDLWIGRGLRAQLQTGSLLTGALFVELDFHPDTPADYVTEPGSGEIPTVPSTGAQVTDTLRRLPVIVENLQRAVSEVADGIEAADLKQAGASLDKALVHVAGIADKVDAAMPDFVNDLDTLTKSMDNVAKRVDTTLEQLRAESSELQVQLSAALSEFASSARAIRVLADYLERHPEALIKGKSEEGGF